MKTRMHYTHVTRDLHVPHRLSYLIDFKKMTYS
jgi:hypothetical protein